MSDSEYECFRCGGEFGLDSEYFEEPPDFTESGEPLCWACAIKIRDEKIVALNAKLSNLIKGPLTVVEVSDYKPLCDKLATLLQQVLDRPCNKRHHDLARQIADSNVYKLMYCSNERK